LGRGWGGRSGDVAGGVAALPNGDAVLVGDTNRFGAGSDDAFILRLSAAPVDSTPPSCESCLRSYAASASGCSS
jgi:hypothetical protein